jgi:hypothetical protein
VVCDAAGASVLLWDEEGGALQRSEKFEQRTVQVFQFLIVCGWVLYRAAGTAQSGYDYYHHRECRILQS